MAAVKLKELNLVNLYKLLVVVCLSMIIISLAFNGEKSEEMNDVTASVGSMFLSNIFITGGIFLFSLFVLLFLTVKLIRTQL